MLQFVPHMDMRQVLPRQDRKNGHACDAKKEHRAGKAPQPRWAVGDEAHEAHGALFDRKLDPTALREALTLRGAFEGVSKSRGNVGRHVLRGKDTRAVRESRATPSGNREDAQIMAEVINVLRREHANMAKLVNTLEWQITVLEKGEAPDYDIIWGAIDYFLSYPDLYHHPKENLVFSKLCERDPAAAERIGDLRRDHEELAARTRELASGIRAVLDEAQVPRDSLRRWARQFIDYQRQHMEKEERDFFPAALTGLSPEDWAELEARMTDEGDPLFGERVGERHETLRKTILRWERESRGQ